MVTFVRSCLVSVVTTASLLGCSGARNTHELLNSVLWMQTSAEYHVFSKTAYKQAREALDKALHEPTWTATLEQGEDLDKLPPAVILDLDETVLDNTSFEGRLIRSNTSYNRDQWEEWVQQAVAPETNTIYEFERTLRLAMKFLDWAPIVTMSALTGQRVKNLLPLVDKANSARNLRIPTSKLNRFFEASISQPKGGSAPAPVKGGFSRLKIQFLTQAGIRPPLFILFTSGGKAGLHFSYLRYVENQLREEFEFFATPIRLVERHKVKLNKS